MSRSLEVHDGASRLTCDRLLRDAELFESRIGKIEGAGDLGTYIVNIVKEKAVVQPRQSGTTEGSESTENSTEAPKESADAPSGAG